jgi:competence protein ComEC
VAALLVIGGLMLGREAISLRLIATGALIVLLFWPEAVVGPSFQMSFAAVTSIVALYEWPPARAFFARREEGWLRRIGRFLAVLLITGLAVEIMLMPIALYHFHRAGIMGALANMIAIPMTSFVIMPAEALALLLDTVGLGAPAWYVTGQALKLLLALAHAVSSLPYAVMAMPAISGAVFALSMLGLLWLLLWRGRLRLGGIPIGLLGLLLIVRAPMPDILVTADGRHVAVRTADGGYALLRARAGDYVRSQIAESAGYDGEFGDLASLPWARCSPDLCAVDIADGAGRPVRILATRSGYRVPWQAFVDACAQADIVVADRMLPRACTPRWLKLDRTTLTPMGGAMILLDRREVIAGKDSRDRHPWTQVPAARSNSQPKSGD